VFFSLSFFLSRDFFSLLFVKQALLTMMFLFLTMLMTIQIEVVGSADDDGGGSSKINSS